MAKYHFDIEQYSEPYERLKLGLPTSSNFSKIITPGGKPSTQWEEYAFHLIAERWLKRKINTYTSQHMENGLAAEPTAAEWYDFKCGVETKPVGFVTTDDGLIGCSPDRLVGELGLLEIKCPQPQTMVKYFIKGKLDEKYTPQIQGQLFVTGREYVDILAWHPEIARTLIRVERNNVFIACLESLLADFNDYLAKVMQKIGDAAK